MYCRNVKILLEVIHANTVQDVVLVSSEMERGVSRQKNVRDMIFVRHKSRHCLLRHARAMVRSSAPKMLFESDKKLLNQK